MTNTYAIPWMSLSLPSPTFVILFFLQLHLDDIFVLPLTCWNPQQLFCGSYHFFHSAFLCCAAVVDIVHSLSWVWFFVTPGTTARQASLASITISWGLLKLMSVELVMPSSHRILCHPFSSCLQFFSSIRVFSNELALHLRWLEYWNFSISPSSEYSGLISFRIDWFTLLAVQGTLISSALSLYGPTFTSVHDYWKKHSFDCMKLSSVAF